MIGNVRYAHSAYVHAVLYPNEPIQLCLFDDYEQTDRQLKIEKTAGIIRKKYGSGSFVLGTSVSTRETSFMPERKFNPLRRTQ